MVFGQIYKPLDQKTDLDLKFPDKSEPERKKIRIHNTDGCTYCFISIDISFQEILLLIEINAFD